MNKSECFLRRKMFVGGLSWQTTEGRSGGGNREGEGAGEGEVKGDGQGGGQEKEEGDEDMR
jgi:hypothetical protein